MDTTMVTVASYTDLFEAEMVKALLQEAGFEVALLNERMMSMYPSIAGDMYMMQLQVPRDAEEQVKDFLLSLDDAYLCSEILKKEGALLEGHFSLTSGKHSDRYIEKIKVLQNPEATHTLCKRLAERLQDYDFDTVIGPAYGGIVLAYDVARVMGKKFIFCQRKDGEMSFRSGFDLGSVQRAVVIEDILSTGGSINEVLNAVKKENITVVAIGLLVDRTAGALDFGVPLEALLSMEVPLWDPEACELCKHGIPLVKPGSSDKRG
ncbi:MAG: orotate phosphoribosyltransferase [Candidatus Cloacimonetes bacterium]|nr:orotate phosphoribosyltransferase [Candidatus Cloacimonadota bacterium]MDD4099790.1 orotate phosphoribosyltransferase [Candidatus Cloacimonadota bacterium]